MFVSNGEIKLERDCVAPPRKLPACVKPCVKPWAIPPRKRVNPVETPVEGSSAEVAIPRAARASATRASAIFRSRFDWMARSMSELNSGSLNNCHHVWTADMSLDWPDGSGWLHLAGTSTCGFRVLESAAETV